MASHHIDRLARSTRAIRAAVAADVPDAPFTRALLDLPVTASIRDADHSELALFALAPEQTAPRLARAVFPTATPLRRPPRNDPDPEVYAHAALKFIRQYAQIRPMPRAKERVVAILDRLQAVRADMASLDAALKQTVQVEELHPPKQRVEDETRRIDELQVRLRDLSLKKESLIKNKRKAPPPKPVEQSPPPTKSLPAPGSPEEDKFWSTPIGPSRTLQFSDNLMDEHVDLADVSMEFHSPVTSPLQIPPPIHEDTVTLPDPPPLSPPKTTNKRPRPPSSLSDAQSTHSSSKPVDTPRTRQRKLNNLELDRTVKKLWETLGDVLLPHSSNKSMPVNETISHIQNMANSTPQPDSPNASSVSSVALDAASPPSAQQVLTAHLLVQLLSPPYTVPLKQLKESIMLKAQTCGVMNSQGRATQIVFNCVAKGLVKIDRSSREQFVKFDI